MTTTTTESAPALDLDRVERDARERIAVLGEARGRLALDSLSDESVRQELADIESELAAAEGELARLGLARAEQDRREVQAREEAARKRRERAGREARRLDGRIAEAASAFHAGSAAMNAAAVEHRALSERRQALLFEAGLSAQPWLPMAAYQLAFLYDAAKHGTAAWWGLSGGGQPRRLDDQ